MFYMKLGRYWMSSEPVATCDRPTLFGFTTLDSAEFPRIKKSVLATGAKSRAWYER